METVILILFDFFFFYTSPAQGRSVEVLCCAKLTLLKTIYNSICFIKWELIPHSLLTYLSEYKQKHDIQDGKNKNICIVYQPHAPLFEYSNKSNCQSIRSVTINLTVMPIPTTFRMNTVIINCKDTPRVKTDLPIICPSCFLCAISSEESYKYHYFLCWASSRCCHPNNSD